MVWAPELIKAGRAMSVFSGCYANNPRYKRLLEQAARELLLSQSSDWSFILRAGTTTEIAKERVNRHLKRFWKLIDLVDSDGELPEPWLSGIENEDNIFPDIEIKDWIKQVE